MVEMVFKWVFVIVMFRLALKTGQISANLSIGSHHDIKGTSFSWGVLTAGLVVMDFCVLAM